MVVMTVDASDRSDYRLLCEVIQAYMGSGLLPYGRD